MSKKFRTVLARQCAVYLILIVLLSSAVIVLNNLYDIAAAELNSYRAAGSQSDIRARIEAETAANDRLIQDLDMFDDRHIDKDIFLSELAAFINGNNVEVIRFSESLPEPAGESSQKEPTEDDAPEDLTETLLVSKVFNVTLYGTNDALHQTLNLIESLSGVYRITDIMWLSDSVAGFKTDIEKGKSLLEQLTNTQAQKVDSLNAGASTLSFRIEYFTRNGVRG